MKVGWKIKPLAEVCDIVNGSTPLRSNKAYWENGNINWFTIEDIREQGRKITRTNQKITHHALEKTSVRILPSKSVLLCCTASIGEYAITEAPMATNQQFNGLVVKNQQTLEPLFLFHFCATLKDKLAELSGKTTIDFIPISRLRDILIPVPPIPEQQRIVTILDQAFEGIATATANAKKNLANARELFESELQYELSLGGEDWTETTLGNEVDLLSGFPFKSAEYTTSEKDVRLLRGDNIIQGSLRWDDVKSWPASGVGNYERYNLNEGDVVLAMDRPWVNAGLKRAKITQEDLPCLLVQRTARLRGTGSLDNSFLLHLINSQAFIKHILGVQTGIGVPHISGQQIKDFKFLKPSISIQQNIIAKLDGLLAETKKLEAIYQQKLTALEELKKSILNQAFSGQLN